MRIVFTADLHVHARRTESRDGGLDRLADGLSALRQTLEYARSYGCPWVFAGDLKEPRRSWPVEALAGVLAVLRGFPDVPKVMVKGNHDGEGEHGSGLQPFADLACVVDEPCVAELFPGFRVAFWPDVFGPRSLVEFVAGVPGDVRFLVGHGFVSGARLGPDDYRGEGSMSLEAQSGGAQRWDACLLGDVHKGQVWHPTVTSWSTLGELADESLVVRSPGSWCGEVVYCGSPYQQTWGEREDGPKGALLVGLSDGSIRLLPVVAPRYVQEEWPERPGALRAEDVSTRWCGNFVRVVAGSWVRTEGGARDLEALREHADPRTLSVEVVERKEVERRAEVHAGMGRRDLLEAYVAARPLDGVESGHLVRAGEALLAEG